MILIVYVSTTVFITQVGCTGSMFRLLNGHLRACFFAVESQDVLKYFTDVNTLGSQCVHSIL